MDPYSTASPHHAPISRFNIPPPLPPPPRDLPEGYRASTEGYRPSTSADSPIAKTHSRGGSREEKEKDKSSPATTPAAESPKPRRGSFGFLSRSKSRTHEIPVVTSADGHTILRKPKVRDEAMRLELAREAHRQRPPPVLPSPSSLPTIDPFDGSRPASIALTSNKASNFSRPQANGAGLQSANSMPAFYANGPDRLSSEYGDHPGTPNSLNSRFTTMTASTIGNINSPRRIRRRKDPTPFNILVMGAKDSGKTSFINFLKDTLSLPAEKQHQSIGTPRIATTDGTFTGHYLEAEFDKERVGLTLWDTKGLEKNLVDLQIREAITFIESKFEETFSEESKVMRSTGVRDSHIHCVFLILDPANLDDTLQVAKIQANGNAFAQGIKPAGLSQDLDLQVMKGLAGKATVIPIITKADTLTGAHMQFLKNSVGNSLRAAKLDPLEFLNQEDSDTEDDESDREHDLLPIQSTNSSEISRDHRTGRVPYDSDYSDEGMGSTSTMGVSRSSATTPSPQRVMKRPNSRLISNPLSLDDPNVEEIFFPFTVLSPDPYELNALGRRFPWGMADPFNPGHCDYVRLRDSIFLEWREELRSTARVKWYEAWRTSRLAQNAQIVRESSGLSSPAMARVTGNGSLSPLPYHNKGLGFQNRPISPGGSAQVVVAGAGQATAF